jgi:predicted SAM-dependent methyltransferase
MIKLNLGSGDTRVLDHIGIDLHPAADIQHDLTTPLPYRDGTVDRIYSSHVIEHFTRREWEFVRHDWPRVLKPGGIMELRCPDIAKLCQLLLDGVDVALQIERIYGQQGSEGQLHKNGFTPARLKASFPDMDCRLLKPSSDYELHMEFTKR